MTNVVTNIVATLIISVVTNAPVVTDNSVPGISSSGGGYYYLNNNSGMLPISQGSPATERTTTVVTKEVHEYQFDLEGKPWGAVLEYEIARVTKREVKRETWIEQPAVTNVERRMVTPMYMNWNILGIASTNNYFAISNVVEWSGVLATNAVATNAVKSPTSATVICFEPVTVEAVV